MNDSPTGTTAVKKKKKKSRSRANSSALSFPKMGNESAHSTVSMLEADNKYDSTESSSLFDRKHTHPVVDPTFATLVAIYLHPFI